MDGKEHLELIDLKTGKSVFSETGDFGEVGYSFRSVISKNPDGRFAFVHNHNTDGWISETDLTTLLTTDQIDIMIAVRNDGVIYIAPKNSGAKINTLPRMYYADDMSELYNLRRNDELDGPFEIVSEEKMVKNMLRDFVGGYFEHDGR